MIKHVHNGCHPHLHPCPRPGRALSFLTTDGFLSSLCICISMLDPFPVSGRIHLPLLFSYMCRLICGDVRAHSCWGSSQQSWEVSLIFKVGYPSEKKPSPFRRQNDLKTPKNSLYLSRTGYFRMPKIVEPGSHVLARRSQ